MDLYAQFYPSPDLPPLLTNTPSRGNFSLGRHRKGKKAVRRLRMAKEPRWRPSSEMKMLRAPPPYGWRKDAMETQLQRNEKARLRPALQNLNPNTIARQQQGSAIKRPGENTTKQAKKARSVYPKLNKLEKIQTILDEILHPLQFKISRQNIDTLKQVQSFFHLPCPILNAIFLNKEDKVRRLHDIFDEILSKEESMRNIPKLYLTYFASCYSRKEEYLQAASKNDDAYIYCMDSLPTELYKLHQLIMES